MDNTTATEVDLRTDHALVLNILERLETAKGILNQREDIENTIRRLNALDLAFRRFGKLSDLAEHLSIIEKKMYMTKQYITIHEAADLLDLSISQIYKLTRQRKFPLYKPNGKMIFLHIDDINAWIAESKIMPLEEIKNWPDKLYSTTKNK